MTRRSFFMPCRFGFVVIIGLICEVYNGFSAWFLRK